MVGIAVGTVAHHLGVDVRTAGTGMLQLFQHQHTAAFAHHEAAAPCVKGQAGCIRIGRGGSAFMLVKPPMPEADAALCTAADHGGLVAVTDAVEGIAYGIGAAGAGRDRAGAHALQTKADGHLCRCHVGNGHGHEIGAYLFHALLFTTGVLLLNGGQTADAAGKDDTDLFGFRFGVQTAVCNCFSGGSKGQNGKAGILRASFLSTMVSGSKPFTSPASLHLKSVVSN